MYSQFCSNHRLLQIPKIYEQESTIADLLVFIGTQKMESNYGGYASLCLLSKYQKIQFNLLGNTTKRPKVGFIQLNDNKIRLIKGNFEYTINLIIHELFHIMGINYKCFQIFPKVNGLPITYKDENGRYYLRSKTVMEEAKDHFKCQDIKGGKLKY